MTLQAVAVDIPVVRSGARIATGSQLRFLSQHLRMEKPEEVAMYEYDTSGAGVSSPEEGNH
ncbi:MAG: hypothetical protein LBE86_10205 [Gemmobacter sp.]|jgi:hypothetical protein|nr:hypothetical protein [Gemmobacter sp.]